AVTATTAASPAAATATAATTGTATTATTATATTPGTATAATRTRGTAAPATRTRARPCCPDQARPSATRLLDDRRARFPGRRSSRTGPVRSGAGAPATRVDLGAHAVIVGRGRMGHDAFS